jgi:diguanylate cyclase (GGDEF)-like protein/PAS domain S-box-containing protein
MTVPYELRRTLLLKLGLATGLTLMLAITAVTGMAMVQYRTAAASVEGLDVFRSVAVAMLELNRFERSVATFELDDGTVATEDVRADIMALTDAVGALDRSGFRKVLADNATDLDTIESLIFAIGQLTPLAERLDTSAPAVTALRRHFETLNPRLANLVQALNADVAGRVELHNRTSFRLSAVMGLAVLLIASLGGALVGLLLRQNKLIRAAHERLLGATESLAETGRRLELANRAVAAANAELTAQNERLSASETQARLASERYSAALENMREGVAMFDGRGRLVLHNRRYADLYRFDPLRPLVGTPASDILRSIEDRQLLDAASMAAFAGAAPAVARTLDISWRDGRVFEIHRELMADGGWVSTHEDVTERRRAEERIRYLARHDILTGLPNRAQFVDRLAALTAGDALDGASVAVLVFELDRFKQINDSFGHAAGDHVLRDVARRTQQLVGEHGFVARLGGDEFGVVLARNAGPAETDAFARRLVEALSEPSRPGDRTIELGFSGGIALAPPHGRDAELLTLRAGAALFEAKSAGRRVFRVFDPGIDEAIRRRRALEADLKAALEQDRLELRYQPIVDVDSERIAAVEALLRWKHPDGNWIGPDVFIPIAEETGLIVPLGAWVLRRAARDAGRWPADISLSVNLSAAQLKSRSLVTVVMDACAQSGFSPSRLELEMTETVLFDEAEALDVMRRLRSFGVRFSLDDFGTGYSSLSYLRRFEFDQLKIDKSFLRDSVARRDCEAIVNAIAGLGRSLGIDTVAEGIETLDELAIVQAAGCRFGQGYLFGRPMTAEEIEARLARQPAVEPADVVHTAVERLSDVLQAMKVGPARPDAIEAVSGAAETPPHQRVG